jgi:hypothetical protein
MAICFVSALTGAPTAPASRRHPRPYAFHFYLYVLAFTADTAIAISIAIATTTGSLALVLYLGLNTPLPVATSAALWRKLCAPICANAAERALQPQKEAPVARM